MKRIVLLLPLVQLAVSGYAQQEENNVDYGQINGNFETRFQYYVEDKSIGFSEDNFPDEEIRLNAFANITYIRGNFRAGVRYENYENPLLGYPEGYTGSGFPYRYIGFNKDGLDITVGNFYEQFGSGLIFRSYEERDLGYDNTIDGIRFKYSPLKGIHLTGLFGKQRVNFDQEGIIRGADAEVLLNDVFEGWSDSKTRISIGGSLVSKYQKDEDPDLNLPENVMAAAWRFSLNHGAWALSGEYAYKINDPNSLNGWIYRHGEGLVVNASYAAKGFGVLVAAKRIDNMNFRSSRTAVANNQLINYLPALTKQHTYTLPALYPYATQPNGEMGVQVEINYKFKRGTALGGKYGTQVAVNFSNAYNIDQQSVVDTIDPEAISTGVLTGTGGYESDFFKLGDRKYFQDFNVEIKKKLSKKWKMILSYMNIEYDKEVIEVKPDAPFVYVNAGILELQYKIKPKHTLRSEWQLMLTEQDRGDWAMGLLEYSISPHYFFAIQDAFNYGNPEDSKQTHYVTVSAGYTKGTNRFTVNYGRQQEGIFCVGGVCRFVPASSGLSVGLSSSF